MSGITPAVAAMEAMSGTIAAFNVGAVVATPGALADFEPAEILTCLWRHVRRDWGDLDPDDKAANDAALVNGARVLSAYKIGARKLWIITEADRSYTTVLLPEEY